MTPETQAQKLAMIATLPERQLRGWHRALTEWRVRDSFPGEIAALHDRARMLGITLER